MSKKLFKELIRRASTPVPAEQDKQLHPESYTGKRKGSRKIVNTSAKRRGVSHG